MRTFAVAVVVLLAAVSMMAATIQAPGGVSQEATGPGGAVVTFTVTANGTGTGDDENGRPNGGTANVVCAPASGSTFAIGTTKVTCNATDSTGTATASFEVTVSDTTAPVLSLPGDLTVQATSSGGANVSFNASAVDAVDGARTVTCTPGPGLFPVGTTAVTCTASDTRENKATGSFSVTVTSAPPPTQPPSLNLPADMTIEASGPSGAAVSFTAGANGTGSGQDDENGRPTNNVSTSCSPASGSTFALGTTTVQCTATDNGGTTSGSFKITVVDTTAPDLRLPRDFTVQATSNDGAAVTFNASATDLVDGTVGVTCSPESGSTFAVGTTAVTCTATDSHGNAASAGFAVTVLAPDAPPPPPQLTLPDDITVEADGPDGAIVTFTVSSTNGNGTGDDENGRPNGTSSVTCAPASGSLFALGTTTVQCADGTASGTFLVTVVDTTAPVLTLPDDITSDQTTVTFDASADDLVDGSVAVTCTPPSGSTFDAGTTTVTCSATDAAGNKAEGSFDVTVNGNPGRVITVKATPDKLWPPNHNFAPVTVSVTISDDSQFTAKIISVSSSENDPNDHTSPDWVITGPLTVDLRVEKSEQAQKRVYTIVVEVVDDTNTSYHKTVTVAVVNTGATQLLKVKSDVSAKKGRSRTGRW